MSDTDDMSNLLRPKALSDESDQKVSTKHPTFAVDEDGIPILADVVDMSEVADKETRSEDEMQVPSLPTLALPRYEELLEAMRDRVKSQIEKDMEKVINKSAVAASEKIMQKMEPLIKAEVAVVLRDQFGDIVQSLLNKYIDPDRSE